MMNDLSRTNLKQSLKDVYANPGTILSHLTDPKIPDALAAWLARLGLLYGVPFNYLVPEERMLPMESIRFFYLDPNWVLALNDGAFSIGRNLTADDKNPGLNLDKAVHAGAMEKLNAFKSHIRSKMLGTKSPAPSVVITGFLLRSKVVLEYPSLGVNVYPEDGQPGDPDEQMLDILRLERLSPTSDTMICLISGDAFRVDVHEAPQALHYGIDCYNDDCTVNHTPVMAVKNLHTFTTTTTTDPVTNTKVQSVTMGGEVAVDISTAFRTCSSRVLDMTTLATIIGTTNNPTTPVTIDSAEMGFEMTQGVGMVSFFKQ
jgi:hypothetical protein